MRVNSNSQIKGLNVFLVPYRNYHVPKYHNWMKSEELQKLTASEPLTLEEEYEMQKSWRDDEDKCTFIILDKKVYDEKKNKDGKEEDFEIESMIGDTNIFIINKDTATAEIEIMIAEKFARGKKFGWEAVILMMLYGIKYIGIKEYEAKISLINAVSLNMFKKLGFVEQSQSEIFQEVTLQKNVSEDWTKWLHRQFYFEVQSL
ncbi:alpha/beta-tubulin-N-acetyltransferase 9 [Maniola hyperantus]|uniref:alpha/beta-tubulin-N-acetyltransferase 9 n=1 Tax=Aphantopus hyperantus TaxID=2795564 RepID=UPI001569F1A7|nr:N-acetyltransferase 9-like protein isoform X1 [Maniola hyperantus]